MGWKRETQALHMPHMNNLDIAVSTAMLKRHSALLKYRSNTMAPVDKIWQVCKSVWPEMDSAYITQGIIRMHRVVAKVVTH